jgi:antitoxin YefM
MTIIEVDMKEIATYIPISKAKSELLDIIRRLESVEDVVAVTKNGVPAAVILSMEKYEGLLETLDILSDETAMKSLRTSMRQARQRKWLKYEEVFGR